MFQAADGGAPLVSIPGGEPLMHPQIGEIVEAGRAQEVRLPLHQRAAAERKIDQFKPSKYFSFVVHMDGQRSITTSRSAAKAYDKAVEKAFRKLLKRGFRPCHEHNALRRHRRESVRAFFDEMMDLGVEA
jgi:MoaA/NifB/PqqE/SkfB family radical SAM enzyme